MSMPKIPDINPDINVDINIKRSNAINFIIASIAMEDLALAHILNAEGEKLQFVLGTLEDTRPSEMTVGKMIVVAVRFKLRVTKSGATVVERLHCTINNERFVF